MSEPSSSQKAVRNLSQVIRLIRAGFQEMAVVADKLHGDLGITASMRAVLETLAEEGPSTVPGIAKPKRVSRQFIQQLADALVAGGYAEFAENPAHKRSQLVRLTEKGEQAFRTITERERHYLEVISAPFSPEELEQVVGTLTRLRAGLAREMKW